MKVLVLMIGACFCLSSCAGTDAPNRPNDPSSKYKKYTFVAEIPVIRPSKIGLAKVQADAMSLVKKYKKGNSVASLTMEGKLRLDEPPSDAAWLSHMKNRQGNWKSKGWNYDSGTTARVYLKWYDGVGTGHGGKVVFVKNGKELGVRSIAGDRNIYGYYKDMAKLGIYIP